MKLGKETNLSAEGEPPCSIAFRLDSGSGVPTYKQLVQQVQRAVRLGYLTCGDQLPRVKDVVASLSINPNTVLKAYRELEQDGLIAGRPGAGTFVRVSPQTIGVAELADLRQKLVVGWLQEAAAAGLAEDEIIALFTHALGDFRERAGPPYIAERSGTARGDRGSAA